MNDLSINLNRANALLLKMRKYVSDPSILPFLIPTYPTVVLSGLRIVEQFHKL